MPFLYRVLFIWKQLFYDRRISWPILFRTTNFIFEVALPSLSMTSDRFKSRESIDKKT